MKFSAVKPAGTVAGSAAEKSTLYVAHDGVSATIWFVKVVLPRPTVTAMAFDPPVPLALNVTRYVPFMMTKFWPAKVPKALLIVAFCPVDAAERRMHRRPCVPGGHSVGPVRPVAPPLRSTFRPLAAPPGAD